MGTIVEATVPVDEFALEETAEVLDQGFFQLERVVAQNADRILPLMWVYNVDQGELEDALSADPTIDGFELVTDLGGKLLYQLNWTDRIETLVATIIEEEVVLLEAESDGDIWELKFLFVERKAIRRVEEHFENAEMTFDVHRLYDQRDGEFGTRGLTDGQHRTLTMALEHGYYDVPRTTDAKTLAGKLDVSHQALSEQLRRAHQTLTANIVSTTASSLNEDADAAEQY